MANDLHRCLIPCEDGVNAIGIDLLRPEDRFEMENVLFVYTICLLALNETEIEMIALFSFFGFCDSENVENLTMGCGCGVCALNISGISKTITNYFILCEATV